MLIKNAKGNQSKKTCEIFEKTSECSDCLGYSGEGYIDWKIEGFIVSKKQSNPPPPNIKNKPPAPPAPPLCARIKSDWDEEYKAGLKENRWLKMIENNKLKCPECGWRGKCEDTLTAANPFSPGESIYGCPRCKGIDRLDSVCDEPGCWSLASCGTQTKNEYRNTCGIHRPEKE